MNIIDKIINFVKSNLVILFVLICIVFVLIMSMCNGCAPKSKKRRRPKPKTTTSESTSNVTKLTYSIIVEGNGIIKLQGNEYKVEELKDFEVQIPEKNDIKLYWCSSNETKSMKVSIKGNGDEKEWESSKGDISFNVGKRSQECFITSIS